MKILAHPFHLGSTGAAVTIDQDSDAATAQLIGGLVATVRGERDLVPTYGVTDPAFSALDEAEVSAGLALHGPAVNITGLDITAVDALTERIVITWANPDTAGSAT